MDDQYKRRSEYVLNERLSSHKKASNEEIVQLRKIFDVLNANFGIHPLPENQSDVKRVLCKFYKNNTYAFKGSDKETTGNILMTWRLAGQRSKRKLKIKTYIKGEPKKPDPEYTYDLQDLDKLKTEIFPYLSKKLELKIRYVATKKQAVVEEDSVFHRSLDKQSVDYDKPEKYKTEVSRFIRDTNVSRRLKEIYDYKCQICGLDMQLPNGKLYIEAHHIKPLGNSHEGPDAVENLIIVCPNDHARLDYGIIPLDPNGFKFSRHSIDPEFIEYHNQNIYKG